MTTTVEFSAPRTILIATPDGVTANHLATLVAQEGWAIGLPQARAAIDEIVDRGDIDLAVVDESWLTDELIAKLRVHGPTEVGTRFVVIVEDPDELEALSWMSRGAAAFLHKPLADTPSETILFVLRSIFSTLHLPREYANELRVRESTGHWVTMDAPSHQGALEQFQRFFAVLHASKLTDEEKRMLHLVFNEIGMNAIEWGNEKDPDRRMRISYAFSNDRIRIRIEDEGKGFAPAAVPDPTLDPGAALEHRRAQGKRLGGYGLALVRKIMDVVEFQEGGRVVYMERRLMLSERLMAVDPRPPASGPDAS